MKREKEEEREKRSKGKEGKIVEENLEEGKVRKLTEDFFFVLFFFCFSLFETTEICLGCTKMESLGEIF